MAILTGNSVSGVVVRTSAGEYLHYEIDVDGAAPDFSFENNAGSLLSAADLGAPRTHYQWDWPKDFVSAAPGIDDLFVFMNFDGRNASYHLTVDHRRADNSDLQRLTNLMVADDSGHRPGRDAFEVAAK